MTKNREETSFEQELQWVTFLLERNGKSWALDFPTDRRREMSGSSMEPADGFAMLVGVSATLAPLGSLGLMLNRHLSPRYDPQLPLMAGSTFILGNGFVTRNGRDDK